MHTYFISNYVFYNNEEAESKTKTFDGKKEKPHGTQHALQLASKSNEPLQRSQSQ